MSNHNESYHDSTRATLFAAWYEMQTPRVQQRLNIWIFWLANEFGKENYTADNALEMAQALIWALANKDMLQICGVLNAQPIEAVKG